VPTGVRDVVAIVEKVVVRKFAFDSEFLIVVDGGIRDDDRNRSAGSDSGVDWEFEELVEFVLCGVVLKLEVLQGCSL